jgi:DNA mismatch repair protein MutS2
VLLDELGTGTDPEEGSALGIGTLRAFLQRGCHLMVATHLKPVKLMGLTEESLEVASVEFDPQSFAPRFRLIYRTVGESMALRMARRLGFPEEILAEAEKERSGSDRDMALALESVRTIREEAERDLQRAVEEREELARLKEREESLLAELSEKRRRAWEKDIEAAQTFLSDLRKRGEELMLRLKKSPNRKHLSEFIAASAREIGGIEERAGLKSQGDAVKVGDSAEVLTGGWKGEVVAFSRDKVVIEREGMRLVVPADRLRKVQEKRDRRVLIQARSEDLPIEIDLRGLKVEEAVRQAGEYLDRAVRSRLDRVKLIHGFGTGALKCALEEYLGSSPYCLSFRAGDQNEGGGGVTFVELIR